MSQQEKHDHCAKEFNNINMLDNVPSLIYIDTPLSVNYNNN